MYWPTRAAALGPSTRIYPRYAPQYASNYQTKIVLEKLGDDGPPSYGSYPRPTTTTAAEMRYPAGRSTSPVPYRPFEYVSYYKPITPPMPITYPMGRTEVMTTTTTTTAAGTTAGTTVACRPKPFYASRLRYLGFMIVTLAIAAFAFEIADVVVASMYMGGPCGGQMVSKPFTVPWFFSWVVPGIWGSIPIFITGILAICVKDNFGPVFQALAILSSLSVFFFAPAIVAINAAEEATFIAYCGYATVAGVGMKATADYKTLEGAKFALPIILIVLGLLLLIILLYLTVVLCYSYDKCALSEKLAMETAAAKQQTTTGVTVTAATLPPPPQPAQPVMMPLPAILPAFDYGPMPAATLPPPPPRDLEFGYGGVPGRLVHLEAHNHGYAFSNFPGYIPAVAAATATPTTLPAATTTMMPGSGYYWK